jgi:hypothetical protein
VDRREGKGKGKGKEISLADEEIQEDCPLPKHAACELYDPVYTPLPVGVGAKYETARENDIGA